MIKVNNVYGIDVNSYCYVIGEMVTNKDGKITLQNAHYFSDFESCLTDVYRRMKKKRLSKKDMELKETIKEIKELQKEFIELTKELRDVYHEFGVKNSVVCDIDDEDIK